MAEKKETPKPVNLVIQFESREKLAEWFGYAQDECQLDKDEGVFLVDGTELTKTGEVFVVARDTSRPQCMRLKIGGKSV